MCRYAKKIPSEVAEWLEYMKNKTGAVFFMLAAYTDEDGGLSIAKSVEYFNRCLVKSS